MKWMITKWKLHACVCIYIYICIFMYISFFFSGPLSWWIAAVTPCSIHVPHTLKMTSGNNILFSFYRQRCLHRQHEKSLSGSQFWSNLLTLNVVRSSSSPGSWDLALVSSSLSSSGISRSVQCKTVKFLNCIQFIHFQMYKWCSVILLELPVRVGNHCFKFLWIVHRQFNYSFQLMLRA